MGDSEAVTRGIRVNVRSRYVAERSRPLMNEFFFAYTIRISNEGRETVQLVSRAWHITDAEGHVEEVRGPGVVGEQPVLAPGRGLRVHVGVSAHDAVRLDARHVSDGDRGRCALRRGDRALPARRAVRVELIARRLSAGRSLELERDARVERACWRRCELERAEIERILADWPVARLATLAPDGRAELVPIVFAESGGALWSPIDGKPKRGGELARVRNLRADPRVCVLLDHYDANWERLWWLRVDGPRRSWSRPRREAARRGRGAAREVPALRERRRRRSSRASRR